LPANSWNLLHSIQAGSKEGTYQPERIYPDAITIHFIIGWGEWGMGGKSRVCPGGHGSEEVVVNPFPGERLIEKSVQDNLTCYLFYVTGIRQCGGGIITPLNVTVW
jgi:hypothetical protein